MIKLLELIKKNFKLLVRAKVSALVIFLGPLLLVSLLGLAYSQSSTFTLTSSVYSGSYSELSDSLVTKMTNQNFRILKQESLTNCIGSVKRGESQACIVFPGDMRIREDKTNQITFYVDYSQINLVWFILDVMSARVSERSQEISKELTEDILDRLWFIEDKVESAQSTLTAVQTKSTGVKAASGGMQEGFQKLDISVDFKGLDIEGSKAAASDIASLLSAIKANISGLVNSTASALNDIEGSVSSIKSDVNDSAIMAELEDIDEAADDLEVTIDNAIDDIDGSAQNASVHIATINESFNKITKSLADTQAKINSVKSQRDSLLPEFDKVSSDITGMISSLNSMQGTLNQALQKILAVKGRSAEKIITPITTKIEPVAAQKTHFNALFPTLLVLIIMITGILLASTLIIVEKKSKAFFRNNFTPTSYFTFNLSTYITSLMVIFIQLVLFVSVSAFFFETEVLASVWLMLLIAFLTATVFICIGMLVGFLFRTEETTNLAAITLVAMFLLFSSAVIPLESLPSYIKEIAMFNPFVVSELALKQTMIFHFGFTKLIHGIGTLAAYAVGLFLLLVVLQNALRRLSFMHFNRIHLPRVMVREKKASTKISAQEPAKKDINELAVKK